jgi:hypothetical protein
MFFCLLLFEGTFTSFFKDKKSQKSQNSRNQGFSYYFCLLIEGSRSGRAQKHVDPVDPDPADPDPDWNPEHWFFFTKKAEKSNNFTKQIAGG